MKQKLLNISLLLFCLIAGMNSAWAQVYTLDATDAANKGKDNSYAGAEDITINDITWNVTGNTTMAPWRIGGKSISKVDRTVYTKTAYPSELSKITLEIGEAQSVTINSIKLLHSTNSDFSNATTITTSSTEASSTYTFEPEKGFPANSYYKIIFNLTISSTSNKFVEFKGVKFYSSVNQASAPSLTASTTFSENPFFAKITNNETGSTVYYTTDGSTPNTSSDSFTGASKSIEINQTTTVKAMSVIEGKTNSLVKSETYTFKPRETVTIPFSFNGKKSDIDNTPGISQEGLGTDYSSAPYLKFDDTNDYVLIYIKDVPENLVLSYRIKGNGFSGGTFDILESEDENEFTSVRTHTSLDNNPTTFSSKLKLNTHFVKFIYTSKSSGNVALGRINLSEGATITLASACTDGTKSYGTFSCESAFIVPEDITVSTVGVDAENKLVMNNYKNGDIVAANTGVMVSGTAGDHYVSITSEPATVAPGTNNLHPSSEQMTDDNLFYRLTMHNGKTIGYWWGAENGGAFNLAANKAYLAVPTSSSVKLMNLWFSDDDATAIQSLNNSQQSGIIYDLSGRRVEKATKGMYIIDGKKVMVK